MAVFSISKTKRILMGFYPVLAIYSLYSVKPAAAFVGAVIILRWFGGLSLSEGKKKIRF